MTTKCSGIMGRIFGHKWCEYGTLMTRTQLCLYLHHVHPMTKNESIPPTGKFCLRCGAVKGEKK